jgi:hypothetical protein
MSGATKEARFGFPSKMVLISGSPKAKVFCDEQKMAATISGREKLKTGKEKTLNRTPIDPRCSDGSSVNSTRVCLKFRPSPLVNALQKAFQTIPRRMIYMTTESCSQISLILANNKTNKTHLFYIPLAVS